MKKAILIITFMLLGTRTIFAGCIGNISQLYNAKIISDYSSDIAIDLMDTVIFGNYYQSDDIKKEPLEWIVVDKQPDRCLLLSKYVLNCVNYDDDVINTDANLDITWEKCGLRKYLNDCFIKEAFNESEQKKILLTDLINEDNQERDDYNPGHNFNTEGGEDTKDKIFCLSLNECKKYFEIKDINLCNMKLATKATEYAKGKWGTNFFPNGDDLDKDNCSFWLRSPGCNECHAMFVAYDGTIDTSGEFDGCGGVGIRPAMWVKYK